MKIDVNVKLYFNNETGAVYTEEEIKAQIKEDVESEIAHLKSGDFYDYNSYFEDFYVEQDLTPLDLVDYIFDKDRAECFVDKYAHFITERYTEGRFAELCLIEKKIQVEI
jgi:hypothetical protein